MDRRNTDPSLRGHHRETAIALVEVLVALSVLAVGFLSLIATLTQNSRLQRVAHAKHVATVGAESVLEDLRRSNFDEIVADFGPGGVRGPDFDVPGLNVRTDDADGHVGRIRFILNETATDSVATSFEIPRDLNGDGDACDANVASGYRLLPVRVEVEWTGPGGDSHIEVRTLLIGGEDSE